MGVSLALFSIEVAWTCVEFDVPFVIENPASSRLWTFPPMRDLMNQSLVQIVVFDMCQYGGDSYKPIQLVGTLPDLQSLARRCGHDHVHVPLSGSARALWHGKVQWVARASLAGVYRPEFCSSAARVWAQARARRTPASGGRSDGGLHARLLAAASREAGKSTRTAPAGWRFAPSPASDPDAPAARWLVFAAERWRATDAARRKQAHGGPPSRREVRRATGAQKSLGEPGAR